MSVDNIAVVDVNGCKNAQVSVLQDDAAGLVETNRRRI